MMKYTKRRLISVLLVFVLMLNLTDAGLLSETINTLRAYASKKDYAVGFKWDISELILDGKADDGTNHPSNPSRYVELSNGGKTLKLKEVDDEHTVLKTTFSFNLKKAVDPGNLTFKITGLDELIRDGSLVMNMNDPNLVKTWEITRVEAQGDKPEYYVFKNKVRVTSNNETTFTWQFDSRAAVNLSDIELKTDCIVTEVETITNDDGTVSEKKEKIELTTAPLRFQYESVHDEHDVKIVAQNINDLDANNLNVDYDWRSYYSVLGLMGLQEYEKKPSDYSSDLSQAGPTTNDIEAQYIAQITEEQKKNRHARGIRKADHFIEVKIPKGLDPSHVMVVDRNGAHVKLSEYTITTKNGTETLYGFYDFKSKTNLNLIDGESYSSVYRVGILYDDINKLSENDSIRIDLEDHFIVTYDDESVPVDITDTAAHSVQKKDVPHIGTGNWKDKHNRYEINTTHWYNDVKYDNHAKHYNPQYQLLYDAIFNGKVVTYHLDASTNQAKIDEGETSATAKEYDLIFEDAAPAIQNLTGNSKRTLHSDEYDFTRVKVEKLVDGNTVTGDSTVLHGFYFDLYGKTADGEFRLLKNDVLGHSGDTIAPTEIFLPDGIDEIKIVIRDLNIRTYVDVSVDIRYNVSMDDYDAVYIDTNNEHDYVTEPSGKVRHEDTNKGTRLVNTFYRKQYIGDYDIKDADGYTYHLNDYAYSNTWLRDTTTVIDSSASIKEFQFHDALAELIAAGEPVETGYEPSDYYSTVITAGGTVKSDSEKGMNHFVVYSKLPDNVSPSEGWLNMVKDTFQFSAVLQGTGEELTAKDVFDENAVSFYYDAATNSICADFYFDSFALKMDDLTSCTFSYPAEISLAQVKAKTESVHNFITKTYVTVLDDNVKLSPAENKTLLVAKDNPYDLDAEMSRASAKVTISAMGSQRSNESTKQVKSYYNNWIFDNSTTVDGNNTDHLDTDTKRMTSEYTYQMSFHRLTSENEHIIDPVMIDIVEDSKTSAWKGTVVSVTFDADSFPARSYEPEVYYLPSSSNSVSKNLDTNLDTNNIERYDYIHTNTTIKDAIEHFQEYGSASSSEDDTHTQADYNEDLEYYDTLKSKIQNREDGWVKATKNGNEWLIGEDDVYAVAVIYKGDYIVPDNYLKITANMNMRAREIVNSNQIDKIINNRATYNDTHFFAQGKDKLKVDFPMYSVSSRTLVILNHSVELEKVSAKSGKRLTGASFSVYNNGDCTENDIVRYNDFNRRTGKNEIKSMKNMPVDLSGILTLNLAPGIFYYKETVAPRGFNIDSKPYRFRVISDANEVYYYSVDLKNDDQLNREYLVVNNQEYQDNSSIYLEKSFVPNSDVFQIYDISGNPVAKFKKDADENNGEYSYDKDDGNLANISCKNGKIKVSNLPAGSYFIGKSPIDPDSYSFSVADKSSVTFWIFTKSVLKSEVCYQMFKKAGTEITANDEQCWFTGSDGTYDLAESGTAGAVKEISPSSSTGKLTVNGLDISSGYYLMNKTVPRFFKSSNKAVFEISGVPTFTRTAVEQLVKTGRIVVEDDPIESAKANFQKIDATEENRGTLISDAEYSMYLVENDGSETKLYFRFDENTNTYNYVGTSGGTGLTANLKSQEIGGKKGQFRVDKIGYGVYYVQESVAPTGYQLDPDKHYFRVSAATIDENGQLRFGNSGEESGEGGEGSEASGTNSSTMDILSLNDNEVLSTIELNKTEEANPDVYLGYATYKLFRLRKEYETAEGLEAAKEASANSRGNTDSAEFTTYWTLQKNISTDVAGHATIRGVPFGTYLLYEDQPPKGYKWNNDSAQWETWTEMDPVHEKNSQIIVISPETLKKNSVSVTNDDGEEETIYYSFYAMHRDERKTGEARLLKKNASGNALTDGNFTLYQVNFTDKEKNVAIARSKHELTVEQFYALDDTTQQGYLDEAAAMTEDEKKTALEKITLTEDDFIISEHFENGAPKKVSNQPIDTVIKQNLKTSYDPSVGATETISGLDWGVYFFYEVKAPAGYQQDTTPQLFSVDSNNVGSTIEVLMTDDKTYGKIWLYKQAKNADPDGKHLKLFGAQFNLYTKNNEQMYAVPRLRLGGLVNAAEGLSGDQKEFLVTGFTVIDKSKIEFSLENGYKITVTYEESAEGKITSVTPNTALTNAYGSALKKDDTRLTYYIVTKDKTQVYDDNKKKYRDITSADELAAVTDVYVTADEGGQFCVRGLDWASYYFREIIPPEGYGLADDVIFTVNAYNCDNQFLPCEDPVAQAAIIIDKKIPDTSYFKAYGEPTFMFKIYGLTETKGSDADYTKGTKKYKKNGSDFTLAIHLSDPNTSGTAMVNVPVGQYLIEELPVSRYKCTGLEMLSGTGVQVKSAGVDTLTSDVISTNTSYYDINDGNAAKPWTAFCDLTHGETSFGEMVAFHVKYTNEIKRYDKFSQVSFADNQIPGQEYITAFKPMYEPLVTVSNTAGSYTYTINLAEAFAQGEFKAALSYNTEKTAWIDSLAHIKFSTKGNNPIQDGITFDGTTLSFTVDDPASLAGQSVKLDVGYCEDANFTVYNEENTHMVKGELWLTFSDVKADVRKRVILRNDVTNKTYFPYADTNNKLKDVTAVSVVYIKDAETDTITSILENPVYTSDIKASDKKFSFDFWYLLNSDGRPVFNKNNELIKFKKEEIEAFVMNATKPESLTDDLLTDEINSIISKIDKTNSFTFQAAVTDKTRAKISLNNTDLKTSLLRLAGNKAENITSIKYVTEYEHNSHSAAGTIESEVDLSPNTSEEYPLKVMAYSIKKSDNTYDVYLYTVDGESRILMPADCSKLFQNCYKLSDLSGMEYFDTSQVTNMSYMFQNLGRDVSEKTTQAIDFTPLQNWDTSKVTNMSYLFANSDWANGKCRYRINMDFRKWDLSKVTTIKEMFRDNHWSSSTDKVPILGGSGTNTIPTTQEGWYTILINGDLSKVTDMDSAFKFVPMTSEMLQSMVSTWKLNGSSLMNLTPKDDKLHFNDDYYPSLKETTYTTADNIKFIITAHPSSKPEGDKNKRGYIEFV